MSASLKSRETPAGKLIIHKDESSLGIKFVCNYRAVVHMLSYPQVYTQPEVSMAMHQCARFCNNPCLVHEHAIRRIANYLASMSTYV